MKTLIAIIAAFSLAGCATCQQHPYACAIGGAIVVGTAAAMIAANDHHHHDSVPPPHHQFVCSNEAC